ncbi:hypothetical protein D8B26_004431 [Coccidioides posadasii str. Silveira]|uniref:uncharacterized protein n=1 Tax=Coccidioides posadasii (strain RMSCC 757 / Silveira) TaxID=443226 RepID=UPI001BEDEF39|nr:hypothetical protein D8B26_004431 [Coccidioides posadasii str. Silveira]
MFWDASDSRQIPEESAGTDAPGPGGADEGSRDEQSTNLKRGAEGLEEQTAKRPRVASASSAGEGSFTTLRPHFLSLRLDERPQFLSWLFEGALASCTPDSDEGAPSAIRKDSRAETEETRAKRGDGKKGHGDKRWRWSAEEDARLRDMMEGRRSWSEIEKCFPERTESALRQRQSKLQKDRRRICPAKPAAATPAVAVVI